MWGQIAGAVIGGVMGNRSAKHQAAAMDRANAAKMAGFNQYKPFVDENLTGGQDALKGVLDAGYYDGPTYAGPNDFSRDTATAMGGAGGAMINRGAGMMDRFAGFGDNSQGIYGQYNAMANDARNTDRLAVAQQYALDNSQPMIDAAMRDDRRNLQENVLPSINQGASASGNTASSRAGVAEAIANRGYDDRRADVTAGINDAFTARSLGQQNTQFNQQGSALQGAGSANNAIRSAYSEGLNTMGEGANFGMNAGNVLQGYDQAAMDDARARFEGNRDFALNQRKDYMATMLGRAPDSSQGVQSNNYDPVMSTISGAAGGFGFMGDTDFSSLFGGGNKRIPASAGGVSTSLRPRVRPQFGKG
jgi:hypothetical protein